VNPLMVSRSAFGSSLHAASQGLRVLDRSISAFGVLLDPHEGFLRRGEGVVAIQFGDPANADFFRAGSFTLILVGAVAEAFFVHLADHAEGASVFFRLALGQGVKLAGFGRNKEHGTGIFAGGDTGATTNAGSGVHGGISDFFSNEDAVGVRGGTCTDGHETTRLLNAIKSTAVDHEVFDDREGFGAEWLDPNGVAIAEFTHVKLAGRCSFFRAVGDAVDGHGAHAADAFTAIMVKGHGIAAILNQALIDDVHHLQEGGMIGDLTSLNILEMTGLTLILTPDFELEVEE